MMHIKKGEIDQSTSCARHLLELEYFISRNYKHDMRVVKACHSVIKVSAASLIWLSGLIRQTIEC